MLHLQEPQTSVICTEHSPSTTPQKEIRIENRKCRWWSSCRTSKLLNFSFQVTKNM